MLFRLLDLKKNLQASGEITAFPVQKSAYITTTLSDNELKTLNGVIYLSSRKQRADSELYFLNCHFRSFFQPIFTFTVFLNLQTSSLEEWET